MSAWRLGFRAEVDDRHTELDDVVGTVRQIWPPHGGQTLEQGVSLPAYPGVLIGSVVHGEQPRTELPAALVVLPAALMDT